MSPRRRAEHLAVIALFSGLTLLFLAPLSAHLATALTDAVDPLLVTWILAWDVHALLTQPGQLFQANIFWPYADALAYSETLLGSALLIFPLALAGDLPVLNHNLVLLSGFVLGGYTAFLLGKMVTRHTLAAILVGVVFVFNAYRLSMTPKTQMLTLQWLPLALIYLWRVTRRGRGRARWGRGRARWGRGRDALLLAFFLILQSITTLYYGLFTALMLALLAPLFLLAHRRRWPRSLAGLTLAALLSAAAILLYALPYLRVSRTLGLERTLADALPFAAALRQWALVDGGNLLYGRWLALADPPMVGPYPVDFLFPGLLAPLLALLALILARGQGRRMAAGWTSVALLLIGAGFLLSLGPQLMIEPLHPLTPTVTLPYTWLHTHLPGFAALRAPARFAAFVMLGIGLLAGMAIAALGRRRVPRLLLAAAVGAIFLESLVWPATTVLPVPQGEAAPAVYAWLAQQPPGGVVELPAALPQQRRLPERWLWPQYFSIFHWRPTPTGYSGFVPPRHEALIDLLNRFPDPQVLPLYQALDVRFVLLHRQSLSPAAWQTLSAHVTASGLPILWQDERVWVVGVAGQGAPAQASGGDLFLPASALPAQPYTPLLILDLAAGGRVFPPGSLARGRAIWQQQGRVVQEDAFTAPLPFLAAERTALLLSLPAPPAPGVYDLRIQLTEPVALAAAAAIQVAAAPPAAQALPLALQDVQIACNPGQPVIHLTWLAWGWVDTPHTLYLHLLDANGAKIAQVDAALDPPPAAWPLRTPVPITQTLDPPAIPPASLRLGLYAWADAFQTIIPAHFFAPDRTLTAQIDLPWPDCAPAP